MKTMATIYGAILALTLILAPVASANNQKQDVQGIATCSTWTTTLTEMWSYRKWDVEHIKLVEKKMKAWKYNQTPIDISVYSFWSGGDEANLRAFVRDQRFGHSKDSIVVTVDEFTRYTVFICECGLTAVYLGIKPKPRPVVKTVPQRRTIKRPPPSGGGIDFGPIPDARCPENAITHKPTC